jgi:hypothetical protein
VTESAEHSTKPLRTWRPMAAWTGAILLALGLAWFVAAVVVPVWQVHRSIDRCWADRGSDLPMLEVEHLGGQQEAAKRVAVWWSLPKRLRPHEVGTVRILSRCGPYGVPKLITVLEDERADPEARGYAAEKLALSKDPLADAAVRRALHDRVQGVCFDAALGLCKAGHPEPVIVMLRDRDPLLRAIAEYALALSHSQAAIKPLEGMLEDSDPSVRTAAAEALKKIRDEEAPK